MADTYFWNAEAKQVHIKEGTCNWYAAHTNRFLDMFCMDGNCTGPELRYGRFSTTLTCWEHIPLAKFPAEFRAYLLLIT